MDVAGVTRRVTHPLHLTGLPQCSLDGAAFAPCVSPQALTLKVGSHAFAVKATDRASNADPTPASASFKVKKK